jgi:phosphomannomutase
MMKDPIKTYDARWEVSEFNDQEVHRLFEATFGYARLIGTDTLVFARDARLGCARVMEIGIEAAVRYGFRVFACFDPISTPLSYFVAMQTAEKHPDTMGLTITASHNPKKYIGIKFTVPGVEAIGYDCGPLNGLTKVKELYHSETFSPELRDGGTLHIIQHPAQAYIQYTMDLAGIKNNDLKGIKIVLDTFNGSAGPELFQALRICGAEVFPLRLVPNGDFPTGSPNPTSQNKMDNAVLVARQKNADLVIGIDGDGDRVVFGDQNGIFSAGFVMIPILKSILSNDPDPGRKKILYDPKVNPMALAKWAEMNADPVLYRNGHSQIKGYMKEINALAGAEESGHFYHKLPIGNLNVSGENSLFTILLLLEAVKGQKGIISRIREMQDQIYTSGEFNFQFSDDIIRDKAIEAVLAIFENENAVLSTQSENGIDLEGTVVYKGVHIENGSFTIDPLWYSAYVRSATNEKGIVRSYISACSSEFGEIIKNKIDQVLKEEYGGVETE